MVRTCESSSGKRKPKKAREKMVMMINRIQLFLYGDTICHRRWKGRAGG
jgi:hypothetical protein